MRSARIVVLRLAYRLAFRVLLLGGTLLPFVGRRGVKCVLTNADRVLLVRHTYGRRGLWQLPGGGARRGENAVQVADREMREELGLEGVLWRELQRDPRLGRLLPRATFMHGKVADDSLSPDPVEIAEARWCSRREIPAQLGAEVGPALALLDGRRGRDPERQ